MALTTETTIDDAAARSAQTIVKFVDPVVTADGSPRASVRLRALKTLWFNTGTLCNLTCANCYIESSPVNDRLAYLTPDDVAPYLDEIARNELATEEIGFTGGEPFMNPDIIQLMALALERGFRVLVLTNAMRPMMKLAEPLVGLRAAHGDRLTLRVSVDHYGEALHVEERGDKSWTTTLAGLSWLDEQGFNINVAGRTCWDETDSSLRAGYARLFDQLSLPLDATNREHLVLFPEMDEAADVPEITTACWGILEVSPDAMMCATSRMVVKRKGAAMPTIMPCTLLAYDELFEMGATLAEAGGDVPLNHPHCARFCVLGGGACSATAAE
ncbi:MAG: radical SAM protein [Alphaproteobacteria bacterium]|jgi:uncharacterized Fe-S cluster-containing radical SAM superfamily protein|nr:radical SAM protein [Alphaproteobacteria bacterium]